MSIFRALILWLYNDYTVRLITFLLSDPQQAMRIHEAHFLSEIRVIQVKKIRFIPIPTLKIIPDLIKVVISELEPMLLMQL